MGIVNILVGLKQEECLPLWAKNYLETNKTVIQNIKDNEITTQDALDQMSNASANTEIILAFYKAKYGIPLNLIPGQQPVHIDFYGKKLQD